ncbi:hypothetical protein [Candidatus Nanopusillus massiliensis]|nr:hypothetical protein [Candidatus Nanopusillus massiliensis]
MIIMSSIINQQYILNKYSKFYDYRIIDSIHIFFEDIFLIYLKKKF